LEELFQELRLIPGDAAVVFNDTQQIGYLINALRHEKEWEFVCSSITSAQIKGGGKTKFPLHECLAAGCGEETTYPLCPIHYHSLVSAKTQSLPLRNNYGNATFDTKSSLIIYPPKTPTDRLPKVSTLAALPQ
jgi:hypothetical protein